MEAIKRRKRNDRALPNPIHGASSSMLVGWVEIKRGPAGTSCVWKIEAREVLLSFSGVVEIKESNESSVGHSWNFSGIQRGILATISYLRRFRKHNNLGEKWCSMKDGFHFMVT